MNALYEARLAAANAEWDSYDFESCDPVANGWEHVLGEAEFIRTCYFEDVEANGSSEAGHFVVIFEPDSAEVASAYASLNGNDIGGRVSASKPKL